MDSIMNAGMINLFNNIKNNNSSLRYFCMQLLVTLSYKSTSFLLDNYNFDEMTKYFI